MACAAVKVSRLTTLIRGAIPFGIGPRDGRRLEYSSASVEASVVVRMSLVRDLVSSASAWRCCLLGLLDGADMVFDMVMKIVQKKVSEKRLSCACYQTSVLLTWLLP